MLRILVTYRDIRHTILFQRMAHTGLLVLTHPSKICRLLPLIQEHVKDTLYVHIPHPNLSAPSKTLSSVYSQTCVSDSTLDIRVLLSLLKNPQLKNIHTRKKIEVVLFDRGYSNAEMSIYMQLHSLNSSTNCKVINLGQLLECFECKPEDVLKSEEDSALKTYENVVLGGTFDRLHYGHKILLSEAVMHCTHQLTVGVTDTSMLKSKKLWELIEPCEKRIHNVGDFLKDIDHTLSYKVVPITDPYGPTKDDPSLQMIVVSSETLKGGKLVNEMRTKNELPPLDIHVVELLKSEVSATKIELEEDKISSSNYRLRLLGARIRTPEASASLPNEPYIIGLTGGIASGKSTMCKHIERLGAGVVDCDSLAHKLYVKGAICHSLLIEHFGNLILDSDGEIDRKKLGTMVFQNKEKLELLNKILWPHILETAQAECQKLHSNGYKVILLEAALLVQAGWDKLCHEVWLCIVSPQEAVKRLKARNKMTSSEAEFRLAAQPSNVDLIAHAHVVFCTEWDPSFSQYQAEKAWNELQEFLKTSKES